MKTFFLRCDDVSGADAAFRRVASLFKKLGLPLSCAVIPASAREGLGAFLRSPAAPRAEALQHGFSHCEHSGNIYTKQEFGPSRTGARQRADIEAGKKIMHRLFGKLFTPVFVPPFHVYNTDTLAALRVLGFRALSASKRPGRLPRGLAFLGTRVTVNEYDLRLKARPLDLKVLKARTLAAVRESGPAGIYFHPADLKPFGIFSEYALFLKELEKRGLARFALCGELL